MPAGTQVGRLNVARFVWDRSTGEVCAGGSCEVKQTTSIVDAAIDQALHEIDACPPPCDPVNGTYELSVNQST